MSHRIVKHIFTHIFTFRLTTFHHPVKPWKTIGEPNMTRLTYDMRGEIVNAVLFHKYNEPAVSMVKRLALLADDVYNDILSERDRDIISRLPKNWLPEVSNVCIDIKGRTWHRIYFSGTYINDDLFNFIGDETETVFKRIPHKFNGTTWKVYESSDVIAQKITEIIDDKETLIKSIGEDRKRLTATINAFTTVEKLLDAWPEMQNFIPEPKPQKPVQLPALPVEELNKQFNLP